MSATGVLRAIPTTYLAWLNLLRQGGDNLQLAMPIILDGIDDFNNGVDKFAQASRILWGTSDPSPPLLFQHSHVQVTPEVLEAEGEVLRLLHSAQPGSHGGKFQLKHETRLKAIGDGTILRGLWAFLMNNPQLMQLILSLLMPKTSPGTSV